VKVGQGWEEDGGVMMEPADRRNVVFAAKFGAGFFAASLLV